MKKTIARLAAALLAACGVAFAGEGMVQGEPIPFEEQSQWERFKAGAREAGGAIAEGTKRTAVKVGEGAEKAGDAIARGAKKTGHAIAEGYEDAKDYVQEKLD